MEQNPLACIHKKLIYDLEILLLKYVSIVLSNSGLCIEIIDLKVTMAHKIY